ncbi:NUDIX hydrolase [Camelimonas abortus]|uniref:NUDIX hydrolase n=1 Tax=Camelimonas abortus TaxID=1017184 RepID=A0ABV7LFK9_9HYPH
MGKGGKGKRAEGVQVAALPYRRLVDGSLQIMLITSRDTGRWVIPKGWPMKGRTHAEAAAQEAWEEAGLRGRISQEPLGVYGYVKRRKNGRLQQVTVSVFPLLVRSQDDDWPEKDQRVCVWRAQDEAAALVAEAELAEIMQTLDERLLGALPRSRPRPEAPLLDPGHGLAGFRRSAVLAGVSRLPPQDKD